MEKEEKKLSNEESLNLITNMINTAKGNIQDSYVFFLIWGWVVMLASLLHFSFWTFTDMKHPEKAWIIVFVGFILSIIYGIKIGKTSRVSTHMDRVYSHIWLVFVVSYFVLMFFMKEINYNINPLIMLLAGGSTYLSGIIIKFRPLMYGGILLFISAIVGFLLPGNIQLLVSAGAILVGNLIPGYMLKYKKR